MRLAATSSRKGEEDDFSKPSPPQSIHPSKYLYVFMVLQNGCGKGLSRTLPEKRGPTESQPERKAGTD